MAVGGPVVYYPWAPDPIVLLHSVRPNLIMFFEMVVMYNMAM